MNSEVKVTNKNPTPFTDGFSGMQFTFKPNEKVSIPLAAAVHIFGFNRKDKSATMRRLGIANHPDGKQWLNNFNMEFVEYVAKDDLAEIEQLKIDLEAKQAEIERLNGELAAATTEIEQLEEKLKNATSNTKE